MKLTNKLVLLCVLALMSAGTTIADASNYFTFGTNDTVLIRPQDLSLSSYVTAKAHFENRLDQWSLTFYFPDGLSIGGYTAKSGMDITYMQQDTSLAVCHATLNSSVPYSTVFSHITTTGYWMVDLDNDGLIDPYGTVKWEPGDYEMFDASFNIDGQFRNGTVIISGTLSSGNDSRGNTVGTNVPFQRSVTFIVGYERGDVNGDGSLDILDLTRLINYLLGSVTLDEFELAAADFNGDSSVDIGDVTDLTEYLNTSD